MDPSKPDNPAGKKPVSDKPEPHMAPGYQMSMPDASPDVAAEESGAEKDDGGGRRWLSGISTLLWFLMAPLIAILLATYVVQSYQVDGESMETTLQNNDRLIVDKLPRTIARLTGHDYVPKRGDIIIFNQGGLDFSTGGTKQLIKRVIALPGERVVVNNNQITVYNKTNPQGFNPDQAGIYHIRSNILTTGSVDDTLGKHEIFVCGDNRPNSEDSRYFGPVQLNNVVGKLSFRILPLGEFQSY